MTSSCDDGIGAYVELEPGDRVDVGDAVVGTSDEVGDLDTGAALVTGASDEVGDLDTGAFVVTGAAVVGLNDATGAVVVVALDTGEVGAALEDSGDAVEAPPSAADAAAAFALVARVPAMAAPTMINTIPQPMANQNKRDRDADQAGALPVSGALWPSAGCSSHKLRALLNTSLKLVRPETMRIENAGGGLPGGDEGVRGSLSNSCILSAGARMRDSGT